MVARPKESKVSSINREWRAGLEDGDIADAMREFALAFYKLKLTILECALRARTAIDVQLRYRLLTFMNSTKRSN